MKARSDLDGAVKGHDKGSVGLVHAPIKERHLAADLILNDKVSDTPHGVDVNSPDDNVRHHGNDVKPRKDDDQLHGVDVKSHEDDAGPYVNHVKSRGDDVKHQEGDVKPNRDDVKPRGDDVKPRKDDVKPHGDYVKPRGDDVKPHEDVGDVHAAAAGDVVLRWGEFPPKPLPNKPDFEMIKKISKYYNKTKAGHRGFGFYISSNKLPLRERDKFHQSFAAHNMNEYISNLIGVRRTLRDVRMTGTVNSIMDYSPDHLVKEIVLVDDGSTWDFLGKPLDVYMSRYPKVKILRTGSGIGLMRARMLGYQHTTAPTVTFLDSHCECLPGWLEPLLTPLTSHPKTVTTPVILTINVNSFWIFEKEAERIRMGVVDLATLDLMWRLPPPREMKRLNNSLYEHIRSQAMTGSLFSITRQYFDFLGGFDTGMTAWGGENIEMSFKIWMCGGRIETPRCSNVVHVFNMHVSYMDLRKDTHKANKARVASVWMDEYRKLFHGGPTAEKIRNVGHSDLCLDMMSSRRMTRTLAEPCHGKGGSQLFDLSDLGEMISLNRCLTKSMQHLTVLSYDCDWSGKTGYQFWEYGDKLIKRADGQCLGLNEFQTVVVDVCDQRPFQRWIWKYNRPPRMGLLEA